MQALRAAGVACPLGIVLNQSSATPATGSPADRLLAQQQYASMVRWFLDPVLQGRYPEVEGVAIPQAPVLQAGDLALISAPLDFLGVNYYTRIWASADKTPAPQALGVTDMGWEIYPDGLRKSGPRCFRRARLRWWRLRSERPTWPRPKRRALMGGWRPEPAGWFRASGAGPWVVLYR